MDNQILSVSELSALINQTLEFAYPAVTVEGEVTDFKIWRDRYVYFDLKDEESTLNCFMVAHQLKVPLEDGMKLRLVVSPKLTAKGRFSLTVRSYEPVGEGALRRAFELLQRKLEEEGLFAAERKRALPSFPSSIALITALQSAAYRDFIKILNHRWGGVNVKALDVQVQGAAAPEQIVAALDYVNELANPVDVVVLIRGGGSLEDLQAFNTEPVVRAVAGSRTPIVVGVGHETDTSLADLAADVRAATPTDSARLVVPDKAEMLQTLNSYQTRIIQGQNSELRQLGERLRHYTTAVERLMQIPRDRLNNLNSDLQQFWGRAVENKTAQLKGLERTLRNLDPRLVLRRGYAVVRNRGKVVRTATDVKIGDALMVQLAKAQLQTEVKDVKLT